VADARTYKGRRGRCLADFEQKRGRSNPDAGAMTAVNKEKIAPEKIATKCNKTVRTGARGERREECPGLWASYCKSARKRQRRGESGAAGDDFDQFDRTDVGVVGRSAGEHAATAQAVFTGSMIGIAAAGQVFGNRLGATAATSRNPKLGLQVRQRTSPFRNSGTDMAFGDCVADTNEHENNYHPAPGKKQARNVAPH